MEDNNHARNQVDNIRDNQLSVERAIIKNLFKTEIGWYCVNGWYHVGFRYLAITQTAMKTLNFEDCKPVVENFGRTISLVKLKGKRRNFISEALNNTSSGKDNVVNTLMSNETIFNKYVSIMESFLEISNTTIAIVQECNDKFDHKNLCYDDSFSPLVLLYQKDKIENLLIACRELFAEASNVLGNKGLRKISRLRSNIESSRHTLVQYLPGYLRENDRYFRRIDSMAEYKKYKEEDALGFIQAFSYRY